MGAALQTGGGRPQPTINVTPLVDVVLVLLIIFMVITPLLERELAVLLPANADETTAPPTGEDEQILVQVAADGSVRVNDQVLPRSQVQPKVRQLLRSASESVVFVRVHDDAYMKDAVFAMDAARGAGAEKIAPVLGAD